MPGLPDSSFSKNQPTHLDRGWPDRPQSTSRGMSRKMIDACENPTRSHQSKDWHK